MKKQLLLAAAFTAALLSSAAVVRAGDEFTGHFDPVLVANTDDTEKVIFKNVTREQLHGDVKIPEGAHLAAARVQDPRTMNYSIVALLVEEDGEDPVLFVDLNSDNKLTDNEKVPLKQVEKDDPYLWDITLQVPADDGPFKTLPIYLEYYRNYKYEKMGPEDRLFEQSSSLIAEGHVDVNGKKVLVGYQYDAGKKKIDVQNGWLGVDSNGDGVIDLDPLSPESTSVQDESMVFRVGDIYVATKKADVSKDQIVLRLCQAKDYKRAELVHGQDFPDFAFTDFDGKKHKFSDYHGKYVLLDIWGLWCPACREELPYLREANRRFQSRGLVVLGLNTDRDFTLDSMKAALEKSGMTWTHAQFSSIVDLVRTQLRVHSFPTTFLISPEGKIISMNRTEKNELSLRGRHLLESLDQTLPAI